MKFDMNAALLQSMVKTQSKRALSVENNVDKMSKQEYQRRWAELNQKYRRLGTLSTKAYNDQLDELKRIYKESNK